VEVAGAAIDELGYEGRHVAARSPLSGEIANLLLRGNLAGKEEPKEAFWERLLAPWGFG